MAVISISRQYGAGGTIVGDMVARRLGYKLLEKEIIDQVAHSAGVTTKWVEEVEKGVGDRLVRLISEWVSTHPLTRHLPDPTVEFDEGKYRDFLTEVIGRTARAGNVVFVGRGAQYILKGLPDMVAVYLVAEDEDRIASLMERYQVPRDKAEAAAVREEKKRLAFLRGFKGPDPTDPRLYHLVINTSQSSYERAADFICRLAVGREYKAP